MCVEPPRRPSLWNHMRRSSSAPRAPSSHNREYETSAEWMTSSARSKTPCTSSAGRVGCFSDPTLKKGYTTPAPGSNRARRWKKGLSRKRLAGDGAADLDDEAARLLV